MTEVTQTPITESVASEVARLANPNVKTVNYEPSTTLDAAPVKITEQAPVVQEITEKQQPMNEKSGTTYLEVNLPGSSQNPTTTATQPTISEDDKRKRTIIGAAIALVLLVVIIAFASRKK